MLPFVKKYLADKSLIISYVKHHDGAFHQPNQSFRLFFMLPSMNQEASWKQALSSEDPPNTTLVQEPVPPKLKKPRTEAQKEAFKKCQEACRARRARLKEAKNNTSSLQE